MIKTIIFDFWGTVVENGIFPSPVRQARNGLGLYKMPFPEFIVDFELVLMTKKYKDLYEGFTAVCEKFKIEPKKDLLDALVGMWNKNTILAKPFPETEKVLKELGKDYKIALMSNTDCFSLPAVLEKYKLKPYFKKIFLSFETGMLKTNPDLFKLAIKKLRTKKENTLMVGDSIESDVMAASAAGVKAVLVDRRDRREFTYKIITLDQLKETIEKIDKEQKK
jgi:putative hydrolase of the HAD superfamily